jgi:hypothetical protein
VVKGNNHQGADDWGDRIVVLPRPRTRAELVRDHRRALEVGSEITRWFRREHRPQVIEVTPEAVLAALHRAGINPVLMGTHGINVYRDQTRATRDVDVLVTRKDARKAVRVLEEAFPYLEVRENEAVARFVDPVSQMVVIDVLKPASAAMKAVFRHTVAIGKTYRIPDLEMAIVSKYLALRAENRPWARRYLDAGDFVNMVKYNRKAIDLEKLCRLAEKARPGGGSDMRRLVEDTDADRMIQL